MGATWLGDSINLLHVVHARDLDFTITGPDIFYEGAPATNYQIDIYNQPFEYDRWGSNTLKWVFVIRGNTLHARVDYVADASTNVREFIDYMTPPTFVVQSRPGLFERSGSPEMLITPTPQAGPAVAKDLKVMVTFRDARGRIVAAKKMTGPRTITLKPVQILDRLYEQYNHSWAGIPTTRNYVGSEYSITSWIYSIDLVDEPNLFWDTVLASSSTGETAGVKRKFGPYFFPRPGSVDNTPAYQPVNELTTRPGGKRGHFI